jgi:poly(A) polymerase
MTRIDADWIRDPKVQAVCDALTRAGHQALFVGGCVRNALLGAPVADIDIATDARPERVVEITVAAGLRPVPTGIDHGTITVVSGGKACEVTTFRRDVETDGRRARVAFSDRMEEDAARRDFTMNALYATPSGEVLDPIGGLPDLRAGRLRFIGDPAQRIAEDYLRILRFFRFHAWYADPAGGLDAEGLAACAAAADGLDRLSAERIGNEMKKLLAAPDPSLAMAAMQQSGILARVLPGAEATALGPLVHLEAGVGADPDPIRRLASLGTEDAEARLRLSRSNAKRLELLREGAAEGAAPALDAYRHGAAAAHDIALLRAALTTQPLPQGLDREIARGASARFPLNAADLMPGLSGPALGARLRELESRWIASDFTLSRSELLGDRHGD